MVEKSMMKIVRNFLGDKKSQVIKRGLTLKEAQEHCRNPETSSRTCTTEEAKAITEKYGPWFDGYTDD